MIAVRFVSRTPPGATGLAVMFMTCLSGTIGPAGIGPTPSGCPVLSEQQAADADAAVRAYDQPLPASASLRAGTVTVLDDETSGPLGDVEVQVVNYVDGNRHIFRTDSRGRLRFDYPVLHSDPVGNIEVRKNGYVPLRYTWGHDGGPKAPDDVTLRLRRGITMGGVIVAAADRPVEGVTVVMTVAKCGPTSRSANPTGYEIYHEIPSRTGPDGRWRTDSVPPNAQVVNLQLIHPDYVSDGSTTLGWPGRSPKLAALLDQSDRQVLLKGVRINGRVLDDQGRPIAGVQVLDSTRGLVFLEYAWRTVTDSKGRFHIHLPRGKKVTLTVQSKGHQPVTGEVSADPDRPYVEYRLPPGKTLRGRVVDPQGHPIAGARVRIPHFLAQSGISFDCWTDLQGRFEWDSAPEAPVAVQIGLQGYLSDSAVWLTAGDKAAVITLRPAIDLRLEAVDAQTGVAVPRFRIRIGTYEPGKEGIHWGFPTGRTAPRKFNVELEAAKGPYRIEISAEGYTTAYLELPAEQKTIREVIRLQKAAQ
jgi:hypothetical protein